MHQNSIKIVVLRGQLGELISIASRAMLSEAASWGSYSFKLRADHKSPPAHRPVFFSHLPAALPLLTCEALIPPKWLAGFTMVVFFSVCLGACFSWNSTCTGSKGIYCRNAVPSSIVATFCSQNRGGHFHLWGIAETFWSPTK